MNDRSRFGLGSHRQPATPAPPRPGTPAPAAPPRPATAAPPLPQAPARPDDYGSSADHDQIIARRFADEFDAFPRMERSLAREAEPKHDKTNLDYIKATMAPLVPFEHQHFFDRMARHQWNVARPQAGIQQLGHMGGHRPMMLDGANNLVQTGRAERPLHGNAARDWDKIRGIQRINAYTFRGESRSAEKIRGAGGFHPPSTRTDDTYVKIIAERFAGYMQARFGKTVPEDDIVRYIKGQGPAGKVFVEYEIWRAILDSEKFHIGRMVASEFLRGFVSTSRDIRVSLSFTTGGSVGRLQGDQWIYAVHTEGGFLLPAEGTHVHASSGEAEVAHPGSLPWHKVVAFRYSIPRNFGDTAKGLKMDTRTFYTSDLVFFRRGFQDREPAAFRQIYAAMSTID